MQKKLDLKEKERLKEREFANEVNKRVQREIEEEKKKKA